MIRTAQTSDLDPRLDRILRTCLTWGALAVLMLPFARGYSTWIGWMPLWLIAMPATAWWALHRFALPRWPVAAKQTRDGRRRRRSTPQARRRERALPRRRLQAA
ncbi:hypothetical protein LVB87_03680 [Lysobacter sp. KIS68-7]|uniref:hypothetical protein n=1 Tax=Lysobacter sp. KIS68-7 TaxID=2904252 RepID=UPI001E47C67A|nr:hypothetical protein [Lysobacter sp. KIS68-7]UHQ21172.1 hypothetical protein LVB87_03680 [Lysobacter sp. KIS68-7]